MPKASNVGGFVPFFLCPPPSPSSVLTSFHHPSKSWGDPHDLRVSILGLDLILDSQMTCVNLYSPNMLGILDDNVVNPTGPPQLWDVWKPTHFWQVIRFAWVYHMKCCTRPSYVGLGCLGYDQRAHLVTVGESLRSVSKSLQMD